MKTPVKIREKRYRAKIALGIWLCIAVSGCGHAGEDLREPSTGTEAVAESLEEPSTGMAAVAESLEEPSTGTAAVAESLEEPSTEATAVSESPLPDAYGQMALYIQEGFRRYQVEGDYQAYFGPIGEEEKSLWVEGKYLDPSENTDREFYSCNILLEREGLCWRERLAYEYDAEADRYLFAGQYEPVFSKDSSYALLEDSSYAEDILENCVCKLTIAQDANIAFPIRYLAENGPTLRDERIYYPWTFREEEVKCDYYLEPMVYSYRDERLDIDINIQYVQVNLKDGQEQMEEAINEKLREAFFYDEWEEAPLDPGMQIYSDIDRIYKITRQDEKYLSMRIYDYECARWNAHPGEGETGITIDMRTGEKVRLEDVVGKEYTPKLLLESGAFHCMWGWEGDDDDSWITELKGGAGDNLSSYDDCFYLTDTGIGLITYLSRYYTNLEASYGDLGLEGL